MRVFFWGVLLGTIYLAEASARVLVHSNYILSQYLGPRENGSERERKEEPAKDSSQDPWERMKMRWDEVGKIREANLGAEQTLFNQKAVWVLLVVNGSPCILSSFLARRRKVSLCLLVFSFPNLLYRDQYTILSGGAQFLASCLSKHRDPRQANRLAPQLPGSDGSDGIVAMRLVCVCDVISKDQNRFNPSSKTEAPQPFSPALTLQLKPKEQES